MSLPTRSQPRMSIRPSPLTLTRTCKALLGAPVVAPRAYQIPTNCRTAAGQRGVREGADSPGMAPPRMQVTYCWTDGTLTVCRTHSHGSWATTKALPAHMSRPARPTRRPTRFSRPLVFPTLPSRGAGSMISKPGPCFMCRQRSTDGPTVSLEAQRLRPCDAHDAPLLGTQPSSHPSFWGAGGQTPTHSLTCRETALHSTTCTAIWQRNRRHEVSTPETGEARKS